MKIALVIGLLALLTGCAEMGPAMRAAADGINRGVARVPDATIDVRVRQ